MTTLVDLPQTDDPQASRIVVQTAELDLVVESVVGVVFTCARCGGDVTVGAQWSRGVVGCPRCDGSDA